LDNELFICVFDKININFPFIYITKHFNNFKQFHNDEEEVYVFIHRKKQIILYNVQAQQFVFFGK